jgi:hypothetical protein
MRPWRSLVLRRSCGTEARRVIRRSFLSVGCSADRSHWNDDIRFALGERCRNARAGFGPNQGEAGQALDSPRSTAGDGG